MKPHILIVDDDREIRAQMIRILRPRGYVLDFAADGAGCLATAQKENPDLVILDLGLPGEDGLTIIEKLRRIESTAHTPILVVTGRSPALFASVIEEHAVEGFFSKPISAEPFLAAVEAVLAGERVAPATIEEKPSIAAPSASPAEKTPVSQSAQSSGVPTLESAIGSSLPIGLDENTIEAIAQRVTAKVVAALGPLISGTATHSSPSTDSPIVPEVESGIEDLLPDYLRRRLEDCDELQAAVDRGDYATIELLGHRMSGSGGGFGCPEIGAIGAALEAGAKNRDAAQVRPQIAALREYLGRVQIEPNASLSR